MVSLSTAASQNLFFLKLANDCITFLLSVNLALQAPRSEAFRTWSRLLHRQC